MSKICAIHQPNFFPWQGYFDKIKRSDVFVFLDQSQKQKTGGCYVNRTQLNCNGQKKYFSCPIKRLSGFTPINKVEFSEPEWKNKFISVISNYYKKSKNFSYYYPYIENLIISTDTMNLCKFNTTIIKELTDHLGIKAIFLNQSDLDISSTSTQMLIDICKSVNADSYLCGSGASGYQDDYLFQQQNIKLIYQDFKPTTYGDDSSFIPGLSIIDYLMAS